MNEEKKLYHVDLFSGIGGFTLAADWAGFETIVFCEINPFSQQILKKHWPQIPIISDIRDFSWRDFNANQKYQKITLITGGFPCQPFSLAGKRRGDKDPRFLWPEMFRVISEIRPTWIVAENVIGFVSLGLESCLSDLESAGYDTTTLIIPACSVGAPHRRDRVWIIGCEREMEEISKNIITYTYQKGLQRYWLPQKRKREFFITKSAWKKIWFEAASEFCRMDDGIPNRVDRLKVLGEAIVPHVAFEILRAIYLLEKSKEVR